LKTPLFKSRTTHSRVVGKHSNQMRHFLLLIILFFSLIEIQGQFTSIPDSVFEKFLIKKGFDPTNKLDGMVPTAQIKKVESLYLIADGSIKDLTGIEDFTNLIFLHAYANPIEKIDLSKNINLETLYISNSKLKNLDVSNNLNLKKLHCNSNFLTTLDLSENHELVVLYCENNRISILDLSSNQNLKELRCQSNKLTSLNLSRNPYLEEALCSFNKLKELDLSKNKYLRELHCSKNKIKGLELQENTKLERLWISNNSIMNIDVSQNTKLRAFHCSNNKLSTLDVSKNDSIEELWCFDNNLTNLNITNNLILRRLYCYNNQLTDIDTSKNNKLKYLKLNENDLDPSSFDYGDPFWFTTIISTVQNCEGDELTAKIEMNTDLKKKIKLHSFEFEGGDFTILRYGRELNKADGFYLKGGKVSEFEVKFKIPSNIENSSIKFKTDFIQFLENAIKVDYGKFTISYDDIKNGKEQIVNISESCEDSLKISFPYGGSVSSVSLYKDSISTKKPYKSISYSHGEDNNSLTFSKSDIGRYYINFSSCWWENKFWLTIE
jgi:hypothetical protein